MKTRILECTLRDGSYAIDFQFSAEDTRRISEAIERIGFDLIEIGHGAGLGASEKRIGVAAETDEDYMKAAQEVLHTASWGMFCIPGIGELSHIDMAADHGMKFIRIGTNVEDYKQARPFVERARKYGMFVCCNFMKSYVTPPVEFAEYAMESADFGADLVYIVDSAGGMFPDELRDYYDAIRAKSETLRLGFHGHHNLGMGVANALVAFELGFDIVDASLQGFGRSAGNTPSEQLVSALLRKGYDLGIDPIDCMDCGERFIQPLITRRGIVSLDVVAGHARFHSSYMPIIEKYAREYRIDPRRLILAVCERDQVNAPEALVESEAKKLAKHRVHGAWKGYAGSYVGGEQSVDLKHKEIG